LRRVGGEEGEAKIRTEQQTLPKLRRREKGSATYFDCDRAAPPPSPSGRAEKRWGRANDLVF
jgi:hypothetical protein